MVSQRGWCWQLSRQASRTPSGSFFFSSSRRHTRCALVTGSSDVCSSDLCDGDGAAGMSAGFWQGYELELSDFDLRQLAGISDLLTRWQNEAAGADRKSVV